MKTKFVDRTEWIRNWDKFIPSDGVGVEVGTFTGELSNYILNNWKGKLYMIDVWRPLGEEYEDFSNNINHPTAYADTMKNIEGFENRAIMIRGAADDVIDLFADESLDFVYIDANHAYDYVKEDIKKWFKKVKKGGIVSGHDYLGLKWEEGYFCPNGKDKYIWLIQGDGTSKYIGVFGVNPAIEEFCNEHNYELQTTSEWFGTWYFVK